MAEFIATKDSYCKGRYFSAGKIYAFDGYPPSHHFRPVGSLEKTKASSPDPVELTIKGGGSTKEKKA